MEIGTLIATSGDMNVWMIILKINSNLGPFRYLFILTLFAIVCFLLRAWHLFILNNCPLDLDNQMTKQDMADLETIVKTPHSEDQINKTWFDGRSDARRNIFLNYLVRFSNRSRQFSLSQSLQHCAEEMPIIGKMQELSDSIRRLSSVIPAIGLLGTLTGMFMAFSNTDFTNDVDISLAMSNLMEDFALALWTTIIAVILKIGVDLFNNFTISNHINRFKSELSRLRILLIDIANRDSGTDFGK